MLNTQKIIYTLADSMDIAPPSALCQSDCSRLEDLSLKHISFLTYIGSMYESGQAERQDFISIARQWEDCSGFQLQSRETYYKLRSFYLQVVKGSRRPSQVRGCQTIGIERIKSINKKELQHA